MTAKAPPDGYTVLFVTSSFVINPSYYRKINYDAVKEFAPITLMAFSPHVLSVNSSMPVASVKELIALVKSNPANTAMRRPAPGNRHSSRRSCSSSPTGSTSCTYRSTAARPPWRRPSGAIRRSPSMRCHPPRAFIKDGKVRPLAMTSAARDPEFPDVPTFAEAGVPNQESRLLRRRRRAGRKPLRTSSAFSTASWCGSSRCRT